MLKLVAGMLTLFTAWLIMLQIANYLNDLIRLFFNLYRLLLLYFGETLQIKQAVSKKNVLHV